MKWRDRIRDWWRGYTDADIQKALDRLQSAREPGQVILLTTAEFKAMMKEHLAEPRDER